MSRSETMLVTGGAGFIGCNFVRQALRGVRQAPKGVRQAPKGVRQAPKGPIARLVVLDKLTYAGNVENLADVASDPRFSFVEGDIADRALVASLFESVRPTSVVNFAAETHVDRSIDTPRPFVETNVVEPPSALSFTVTEVPAPSGTP